MASNSNDLCEYAQANAQALIQSGSVAEPELRAALSRLYYGAFHLCYEFHRNLPLPGSVGSANGKHEQLIASLTNPMIKKDHPQYYVSVAVGKSLRVMCAQRVHADYHLHEDIKIIDVDTSLKACEGLRASI
ncbi:hypothetical protein KDM87_14960 [Undibacterium sp. FT147W]|uniref:HEPN domain-containing protein n=1 Tax=Undibacterium rivi TaxID=2828729 RepID=A0ABS5H5R3_9BURK|nr:hypothetical protein [Undibacterium rivi]MBR7793892.1 hypothetical protein [Undibacterium rivi]